MKKFTRKKGHSSGFTLVEIMVVASVIGLLASIALPSFIAAREKSQREICASNLRLMENAAQQYLFEYTALSALTVDDLRDFFKGNVIPECPNNGVYTVFVDPQLFPECSLKSALDHDMND